MATSSENSSFGAEIAAEILPCRHIVSENVKQGLPPTHLDVICPGHRDILMSVDPHDAGFNDRERALRPHSPSAPSGSMCGNLPAPRTGESTRQCAAPGRGRTAKA